MTTPLDLVSNARSPFLERFLKDGIFFAVAVYSKLLASNNRLLHILATLLADFKRCLLKDEIRGAIFLNIICVCSML